MKSGSFNVPMFMAFRRLLESPFYAEQAENVASVSRAQGADWLRRSRAALSPLSARGGYPNILGPDQQERVRAFYGDAAPRLLQAKKRYDPENRIRSGNGRL